MKYMNQEAKYGSHSPATRHDVKAAINCGESTFWKLLRANEFPNAFKVGREIRVPWSDIEAYMKRHRIKSRSAA